MGKEIEKLKIEPQEKDQNLKRLKMISLRLKGLL